MNLVKLAKYLLLRAAAAPLIEMGEGGFWGYRQRLIESGSTGIRATLYWIYLEQKNSYIGLHTVFAGHPVCPHGLHGIHISDRAELGKRCVIFQNVTIGSNTLRDTKRPGSPRLGDNVYVGANATIIGSVSVGDNVRIAAGCNIYKDIPNYQTVVGGGGMRILSHDVPLDNCFIGMENFHRIHNEQ